MAKTIPTLVIMKSLFFIYFVSLISLNINVSMSEPSPSNSTKGFWVDMFHRYSLESPYYDPSLSPTQILVDAIQRSINRVQGLNESHPTDIGSGSSETDILPSQHSSSYLMRYKIGSKEVPSLGLLDTGSNLIWTQCFPCEKCFKQSKPHYETTSSITHRTVLCKEATCSMLVTPICDNGHHTCLYYQSYADKRYTYGWLSQDTFTLASEGGTTTRIPGMIFGCSLNASDFKFKGFESGFIGLGRGPLSLVSQLGHFAKGKFSYCMVPITEIKKTTTRLLFGDSSEVRSGADEPVVQIPLFHIKQDPNVYYVKLMGFSVGRKKFLQHADEANFIVDSGAVTTRLPDYMCSYLKRYVTSALSHLKKKPDPKGVLELYFASSRKRWVPPVTLHFSNDQDVTFGDQNMFGQMDASTLCLLVVSAGKGKPSLGFMAQANFMVGYDTEKEQMSFRRTDCSKLAY